MADLQAGQVLIQNDATGKQTVVAESVYLSSIKSKLSPFHGWSIVPHLNVSETESEAEVVKPARKPKKQVEA
jgi:hypothetical protein